MFPMENKSAGGEENVLEMQSDADDSAGRCVPADEVASAVAAVSDEIGDILKDELGDADKADRIELELADLSAELGILAGLADRGTQPGFPSLFEMAMIQNDSNSSSSSVECTWTNRRRPRPHNAKRAIAKGKESRRRRLGRRATRVPPQPDGVSDISDVGADCDSDEHQWTDTTATTSESSSAKEGVAHLECIFSKAEAPPMGQLLLPLLSQELGSSPPTRQQYHRHSDMWQLMMGEEEMVVTELPLVDDPPPGTSSEQDGEAIVITPEDEVALLNFICEGNDVSILEGPDPEPLPEWLQSLYRAWGELGALLYTLVGDKADGWVSGHVLVTGTCSCSTCLARAHHRKLCAALLQRVIAELYTDKNTQREAVILFKALKVTCRADLLKSFVLDCRQVNALTMSPRGTTIVFEALKEMASRGELARAMVESVCQCDPCLLPMDMEHAVERFIKILKCYAASSIILFKVEMYPDGDEASALIGSRYLSHAGPSARDRLEQIAARATPAAITAWTDYQHPCNCKSTQRLSNEERKKLFRQLFSRMMKGMKMSAGAGAKGSMQDGEQIDDIEDGSSGGEMLEPGILDDEYECYNMNELGELVVKPEWNHKAHLKCVMDLDEDSDLNSLNLTSSSLESSSAGEAGSQGGRSTHGGELVRTVRHLMRSIASIERLMQRVLKLQDHEPNRQQGASRRVDLGLSEVDKKLMAMYKRLPDVHRKQLHVYKKQKKLSTACSVVVGGRAPSPPLPPLTVTPVTPVTTAAAATATSPHAPTHALTYHLHRFHEVRRKVMHMKEQQLYYHRLRIWLEDQLKQNGDNLANEPSIKLVDDIKRKRRTSPRRVTKHKSGSTNKPYKILELLKQKAPSNTEQLLDDLEDSKSDVDPPDAFSIEKDDLSDTDTIVGDEMCKEMKDCLAKFAAFALTDKSGELKEFPESISPPLHEISPTNTEPMPVYSPNPNQRLLTVNKLLKRQLNKDDRRIDFSNPTITEIFNVVPTNARRTPMLVEQIDKGIDIKASEVIENHTIDVLVEQEKESMNKYVGLEMKKAFDDAENIINTYGDDEIKKRIRQDENPTLEQICTALMNMENDPHKILVSEELDNEYYRNLVTKIIENLPQMIADLPKIATESLKLPEFVSIINDLPELTNEDQLSPETLKQIRELKLTKNREKVTKNTSKRKTLRRPKVNSEDITMTFEFDSEDLNEIIAKGGKEFETMLQNQAAPKEEFKHVIFSMAGKYALEKLFGHLKDETNPDIIGFLHLHKVKINTFMLSKASSLFDDYVKEATSMNELMVLVRQRLSQWLNRVFIKYDHVEPVKESEIDDAIVKKFYEHVKEIAEKQCHDESYSIDDLEDLRYLNNDKDSLKQITKLLSTSAGSAFDLIIMKLSHMTKDKKSSVTNLKFKYMEVISRCAESHQLTSWIVLNPEIAASVILEMTGLPIPNDNEKPAEPRVDVSTLNGDKKQEFFINKLREMNKLYLNSLPKSALSSGEWLLLLYRLEQLESKLNDALTKANAPKPIPQNNISETHEAEILAARGLSKIIGKSSKPVKKEVKTEPVKNVNLKPVEVKHENLDESPKNEDSKPKVVLEKFEKAQLNEALYAKYENVLKSNGHKELLELFYKIKSYLSKGQPVPECYTNQYIDMCSNIDMSLLNFELSPDLTKADALEETQELDAKNISVIGSGQNPEILAKYTAQALRNAKQTLNAVAFEVAFKNAHRNGSKSESDICDAPKNDCNWTNDCICNSCQETEVTGSCLGDIVKQCYDMEAKSKSALDDKKKEVKVKQPVKPAKPTQSKPCDNAQHQQHVCKLGHSPTGSGSCASEGSSDQPCTCCYCTVFGHAPPITTPVPRNFNETRERLRLILSKKKQKTGKAASNAAETTAVEAKVATAISQMFEKTYGTPSSQTNVKVKLDPNVHIKTQVQTKPSPQSQPQQPQPPAQPKPQTQPPIQPTPTVQPTNQSVQTSPQKPPLQAQTQQTIQQKASAHPPTQTKPQPQQPTQQKQEVQQPLQQKPQVPQVQQKVVNNGELEQRQLQERMAKMTVTDIRPKPLNVQPQAQAPDVAPLAAANANSKFNAQAMDQIRQQQQLKQQQLLLQQQQLKQAQQQQQLQQQQQWLNHQQQLQQQQRRRMSISSCCSGTSHSSEDSYWQVHEDPRDLDALLQYIEGPTRHVDRGKKRAKKQRQRAKKTESRMVSERGRLSGAWSAASRRVDTLTSTVRALHNNLAHYKGTLHALRPHNGKKGKKPKLNPTQQAKAQQIAEQIGELTAFMNTTQKDLKEAEAILADYTQQLEECDAQIRQARDLLHGSKGDKAAQQMQARQKQELLLAQQRQQHVEDVDRERQMMNNIIMTGQANRSNNGYHMIDNGSVSQMRAFKHLSMTNACEDQPPPKQEGKEKKQTWEQALAHMNQLVTNANKEKQKKQKEAQKAESKATKEPTRSQSLPDDTQNLSKKQRKLLARQQAEEEEARQLMQQQQQEAKNKKSDSKKQQDTAKSEKGGKKSDKVAATEQNGVAGKKADPKDNKAKDKKGKENKVEKIAQTQPQTKQPKQQPAQKHQQQPPQSQPQPLTKKERKKESQQKQQLTNNAGGGYINSDVGKMNTQSFKPTTNNNNDSCSIMSQLSSGVLVSDLRLPPGITLTRVTDTHRQTPNCKYNDVPVWKSNELPVPPTPVARPPPVIEAHPSMMMFTQSQINEPPKTIIMAEPPPPPQVNAPKSKKSKKKSKKQTENQQPTTQFIESSKPDGTKMVTLRNPMFHSNLPPVHIAQNPVKKPDSRPQDNMPLPANPCQATITPTSNGMYTIRNPLMSMMHQQSMMPQPQINQMYPPNNYNYVNPNVYNQPNTHPQPQAYVIDQSRQSPITNEKIDSNRLLNLASFTQKNEEGYSLFKKEDSNNQKGFLNTDYYANSHVPNSNVNFPPTVSPNPIGTRPEARHYDQVNDSLFTNNSIHRPEPIGTGLKKVEDDKNEFRGGLYTPFGQEDRNVFRNALFDSGVARNEDLIPNGEGLPYFQRLRAGAKLNNEVTIHHVTESKFYKNAEPLPPQPLETTAEPYCYGRQCWSVPSTTTGFTGERPADVNVGGVGTMGGVGGGLESVGASLDEGYGAVGTRANPAQRHHDCQNMFNSARSLTDLSSTETLEAMQRYEQLYIQKQRMHQLNTN